MNRENKERVGLVTFHSADNFGAVLQTYALSKSLSLLGVEPVIIDGHLSKKSKSFRSSLRSWLFGLKFKKFRKKYLPEICGLESVENIIVGSDQVWNKDITGDSWRHYFGDFKEKKVFSYAASFGLSQLDERYQGGETESILRRYTDISVREDNALSMLKLNYNLDATQVLDPTLLLDAEHYGLMLNHSNEKKYLAVFLFNKNYNRLKAIKNYADEQNLDVDMLNEFRNNIGGKNSRMLSVNSWLTKIKNADLIITDSYHCMIFSILFRKRLLVLTANPTRMGRIKSLLRKLGIEKVYKEEVDNINDICQVIDDTVDYDSVHSIIKSERELSIKFLSSAIARFK